jgi:hypothetical protein
MTEEGTAVGGPVLAADRVGTAALAVVVALAAVSDSTPVDVLGLVVAAVLFLGGCVGFTIGFLRAAGRSRWEVVDLAGLFYLTGSAPRPVRRAFLGLWFAQIAIAIAAVFVQSPPFAVMAPVWGIGLITWWSGRHGTFPPRPGVARR